ncbi:hypothetical protein PS726_01846 [Pseudomonas fluorescens]|nr:hypothetical protein PS647_01290 [Pseudomonas fluorescens]VVN90595.1 hypothetical protein PS726_01846 [Pseudomonas fluorescens]VVO56148.1 hypothetical protein PS843_00538 [Pseudomonas fluorescens]
MILATRLLSAGSDRDHEQYGNNQQEAHQHQRDAAQ